MSDTGEVEPMVIRHRHGLRYVAEEWRGLVSDANSVPGADVVERITEILARFGARMERRIDELWLVFPDQASLIHFRMVYG